MRIHFGSLRIERPPVVPDRVGTFFNSLAALENHPDIHSLDAEGKDVVVSYPKHRANANKETVMLGVTTKQDELIRGDFNFPVSASPQELLDKVRTLR